MSTYIEQSSTYFNIHDVHISQYLRRPHNQLLSVKMDKHCCQQMEDALSLNCDKHKDVFSCPDVLINYLPKFNEYGLIVHDGGASVISIKYCPWCGSALPESKRDEWFDSLEKLGFDDPANQEIPKEYDSDAWYKNT